MSTLQVSLLDAGCGEGQYLRCSHDVLEAAGVECHGYGIDVSKVAVRLAAKRSPHLSYAVASSYVLPFQDQVGGPVIPSTPAGALACATAKGLPAMACDC